MLDAELKESSSNFKSSTVEKAYFEQTATAPDILKKQDIDVVCSELLSS